MTKYETQVMERSRIQYLAGLFHKFILPKIYIFQTGGYLGGDSRKRDYHAAETCEKSK